MKTLIILLTALSLVACAKRDGLDQYSYKDIGQSTLVEFGTVLSTRKVGITGENSGAGAMAGGALGLAAGSNVGGGNGQVVGAVGGAIVGALAGAAAEQAANDRTGIEYTVIKENGETVTIVQNMNEGDRILASGERVMVQVSGSYQRVLPAQHLPTKVKRPKGIKVEG